MCDTLTLNIDLVDNTQCVVYSVLVLVINVVSNMFQSGCGPSER